MVVNALIGILIARTLARHLGVAGYRQYANALLTAGIRPDRTQAADWPLEWLIVAHLFVRVPRAGLLYLRWRAFAPFVWT